MFWARLLSVLCFIIFQFILLFFFSEKVFSEKVLSFVPADSSHRLIIFTCLALAIFNSYQPQQKKMAYLITRFTGRFLGCLLKSCRKKAISGLRSELIIPISYTRSSFSCLKFAKVEFSFSIRSYKF